MARYTTAYSSFVVRIGEVETLRRLAAAIERDDPVIRRAEVNACCRGAIVLLSSHLEAYVKELGEVSLSAIQVRSVSRSKLAPQFFYHVSKDLLRDVREAADPSIIADKVFVFLQNDAAFWDRTGPLPTAVAVDRFNKGFSNPGYGKIDSYLKRFGYSTFQRDLATNLRANYLVTVNMVNHLVDTRNRIAHGDPLITKTPSDVH